MQSLVLTLEDRSRPTPPNGAYPGSPSRRLRTTVWFPAPADDQPPLAPSPLVIYSHGFMSFGAEARYLAEHLASHAYVVVCPDFPLTWMFAPGSPVVEDVVHQPGDVSFLIDTFLSFNQDPASPFSGRIDGTRIAAAGLSLGGMTTFLTAYHPQLRDPRVQAAVVLAGPGSMFTERFYQHADVPLLLIYGDIDAIVDYQTNAIRAWTRAAPRAALVTLAGATHTGFAHIIAATMNWMENPDLLGCTALMAGLDTDVDFPSLLGGEEAGVVQSETPYPCTVSPLPPAMRPVRQLELVRLAAFSFLESRLADSEARRLQAARFLRETLPEEVPEATVR